MQAAKKKAAIILSKYCHENNQKRKQLIKTY
jgi:hypothetical protein